jgi:hypothetical protein
VAALMRKVVARSPEVVALPPEKWASLAEALARVKAVLGPADDLAARDLTQHLRARRLTAGARHVAAGFRPTDKDACYIFTRAFWRDAMVDRPLSGFSQPRVRAKALQTGGSWYFFIRRAELDRLYPGAAVVVEDRLPPLPRGKPGRKVRDDWPMLLGAWLVAVAAKDRDRLRNIDALVEAAENFLQEQIGWAPKDTKDLRNKIRHFLRFVG